MDNIIIGKIYRLKTLKEGYGYVPKTVDTWVIDVILYKNDIMGLLIEPVIKMVGYVSNILLKENPRKMGNLRKVICEL